MKHAACRDLLQTDLVILSNILSKFQAITRRKAFVGQVSFWILVLLKYTQGKLSNARGTVSHVLLVLTVAAGGYAFFTTASWGLVRWCSKKTAFVREMLNCGKLELRHENAMDGWRWSTLEWLAEAW
ncbi:hypothetical protein EV426DRAFT_341721 [Tirmania nivea]|nr:hypothetical protein EV426DRAFT_341721 [Tirmania nivea]